MRFKRLVTAVLVAALGFTLQPAVAIEVTDIRPLIPVTDAVATDYFYSKDLIQMSDTQYVSFYQGNTYFATVSDDAGETWGTPVDLGSPSWWGPSIKFEKVNDTQILMTYRNAAGSFVGQVGTVGDGTIAFGSPFLIYDANNNPVVTALAAIDFIIDGSDWYVYLPTLNYTNFNGAGEMIELHSSDGGSSWNQISTPLPLSEDKMSEGLDAFLMADGTRVLYMQPTDRNNVRTTYIKFFDGKAWQTLSDNPELKNAVGVLVNNGNGLAFAAPGTIGYHMNTFVWETLDSQPNILLNQSAAPVGWHQINSDGGSLIAIQYVGDVNLPNMWGARSAEISISTDFGATWSTHAFEVMPEEQTALEYRIYGDFLSISPSGEILYTWTTGSGEENGESTYLSTSSDSGATWSDAYELIDGNVASAWGWKGFWIEGQSPLFVGTYETDYPDNYYAYVKAMKFNMPPALPDKLNFKAKFEYGRLRLITTEKARLVEWAEQIADGNYVTVTAPNYIKGEVKRKAKRSLARANAIAKILRNKGLYVTVVEGKLVREISPAKGRQVLIEIDLK